MTGLLNQVASVMTVSLGGDSDSFTVSGSTYTSTEGNGSTLTLNGTSTPYTYTRRDGTVARFSKLSGSDYLPGSTSGRLIDVISPQSEKLTFDYSSIQYCMQPDCTPMWVTIH